MSEQQKNKTVRKIVGRVVLLFFTVLALLLFLGYRYMNRGLGPVDAENDEIVEVEIPPGSTRRDIAAILKEKELINEELVFNFYVRFNNEHSFQAGSYAMSPSMSVAEIVDAIQKGGMPLVNEPLALITLPEGIDLETIGERFERDTPFSKSEFMTLIQQTEFIDLMVERFPDLLTDAKAAKDTRYVLEGYLFPATYEIFEESTSEELVEQMISRMNQVIQPQLEAISKTGLNVHEILTLASYIEKEGVSAEDRTLISGVFYNRLEMDMPLQTDPSVSYALGEHRELTTYKDLEVDSPYNTYIHKGVGAGPIASPSETAIEAAIYPATTDYMYFLADIHTGKIYYSKTYEEHLEYKKEYIEKTSN